MCTQVDCPNRIQSRAIHIGVLSVANSKQFTCKSCNSASNPLPTPGNSTGNSGDNSAIQLAILGNSWQFWAKNGNSEPNGIAKMLVRRQFKTRVVWPLEFYEGRRGGRAGCRRSPVGGHVILEFYRPLGRATWPQCRGQASRTGQWRSVLTS